MGNTIITKDGIETSSLKIGASSPVDGIAEDTPVEGQRANKLWGLNAIIAYVQQAIQAIIDIGDSLSDYALKTYVDAADTAHTAALDPHPQYATVDGTTAAKGVVRLATSTEAKGTSTSLAVTPASLNEAVAAFSKRLMLERLISDMRDGATSIILGNSTDYFGNLDKINEGASSGYQYDVDGDFLQNSGTNILWSSSSGVWEGNTAEMTFDGTSFSMTGSDASIRSINTYSGDVIFSFTVGGSVDYHNVGFYDADDDLTFNQDSQHGGAYTMQSWWWERNLNVLKYSSTVVSAESITNGSFVEFKRIGDEISVWVDGEVLHTWAQTFSGNLRVFAGGPAPTITYTNAFFTIPIPVPMTVSSAAVEWVGATDDVSFSGDDYSVFVNERAVRTDDTFSQTDLLLTYTLGSGFLVGHKAGVYLVETDDGNFNALSGDGGLGGMTNSWWYDHPAGAVKYGSATVASPTWAEGDTIQFKRTGSKLEIYHNGSLYHTFKQSIIGTLRIVTGATGGAVFENVSWSYMNATTQLLSASTGVWYGQTGSFSYSGDDVLGAGSDSSIATTQAFEGPLVWDFNWTAADGFVALLDTTESANWNFATTGIQTALASGKTWTIRWYPTSGNLVFYNYGNASNAVGGGTATVATSPIGKQCRFEIAADGTVTFSVDGAVVYTFGGSATGISVHPSIGVSNFNIDLDNMSITSVSTLEEFSVTTTVENSDAFPEKISWLGLVDTDSPVYYGTDLVVEMSYDGGTEFFPLDTIEDFGYAVITVDSVDTVVSVVYGELLIVDADDVQICARYTADSKTVRLHATSRLVE